MAWSNLKEFCQNATIHGLNHIVNDAYSSSKRILWFLIVVASFTYAAHVLTQAVQGNHHTVLPCLWTG